MKTYKKYDPEPEEKAKPNHNCAATNCPMPGTSTNCTKPDEFSAWYCRFHNGCNPEDFFNVSDVINAHFTILTYAHKIKSVPAHMVEAFIQKMDNPKLNKKESENVYQYADRLNAFVMGEVKHVQIKQK